MLQSFFQFLIDLGKSLGYPGLAVLMFINTAIGIPPSEVICLGFGALAARSGLSLTVVIVVATCANVLGTLGWFIWARRTGGRGVGAFFGRLHTSRFRSVALFCGFGRAAMRSINGAFRSHSSVLVLLGRNVPLVRSVISIPAGLTDMGFFRFVLLTTVGMSVWVTAWTLIGFIVGDHPSSLMSYVNAMGVLISLGLLVWVSWTVTKTRRAEA